MNISLNWLTDYVEVSNSAAELGDIFTHIGLNCDGIEETDSDIVFDLEVTSNRPDWLGHIGVARELAAATGAKFTPPVIPELPTSGKAEDFTSVEVLDPDLCPRYTARVIRGVKVGPSPAWLVERLEAVGMRSVNNIVDVTNYVLMEYSQPLHSFDYDKLAGGKIVVRRAKGGERLVSIDETKCDLQESMLVIADAEKPVAIAGVMGGLNTEVTEQTVNVLIEAAQFTPLNIRRTSRSLALMSDSNYRFERGIDPVRLEEASLRACQLILDIAGGELAEGMVDVWANPYQAPQVTLRPERTTALLGMEVSAERQAEILDMLGLKPQIHDDGIVCTIPSHRADLTREADLIEEVARLEGFDKIPVAHKVTHEVVTADKTQKVRERLAGILTASGYDESITFTFFDVEEAALWGIDQPVCVDPMVRKTNNALRPTLIGSLLRSAKTNQDLGNQSVSLYELGSTFTPANGGGIEEHSELSMISSGNLQQLRGAIQAVVQNLAPEAKLEVKPVALAGYDPQASADILLNGTKIGHLGMVGDKVLKYYGLEQGYAAASLRLRELIDTANLKRTYRPLAKFPPVERDLSLILEEQVTWGQVANVLAAVPQSLRTNEEYVTTYRGKPIVAGKKSVTLKLTYRSSEGTLRSEQVDQQINEIVEEMKKTLSAELRS